MVISKSWLAVISCFVVATSVFADTVTSSNSNTLNCKMLQDFTDEVDPPATSPYLLSCGDFQGFVPKETFASPPAANAAVQIPNSTKFYGVTNEYPGTEIGQCYWDWAPHGDRKSEGFSTMASDFQSQEQNSVGYFQMNPGKCKNVPTALSQPNAPALGFCVGYITCRSNGISQLKVCPASASNACPSADQCNSNSIQTTALSNIDSSVSVEGPKISDPMTASKLKSTTKAYSDAYSSPISFTYSGMSVYLIPSLTTDTDGDNFYGNAAGQLSNGKGVSIKTANDDKCWTAAGQPPQQKSYPPIGGKTIPPSDASSGSAQ